MYKEKILELIKQLDDTGEDYEKEDVAIIISKYIEDSFTPKTTQSLDWFEEFYGIFPRGIFSGGKLVRSDRKGTLKKLTKFYKDNHFSKETILTATKQYVDSFKDSDYKFMKCCTYFIDKGGVSELAARCEALEDGYVPPQENNQNNSFFI